jgi:hypothetical protein
MTDKPRITAARLRIVTSNGEAVVAQTASGESKRRGRKPRMPKIDGIFAPVTVDQLYDRRFDKVYPPKTRLYLFIVAESLRGTRPFDLTGDMIAQLGINRHHKSDYLRVLERHGLVEVIRAGKTTVRVLAGS